MMKAAIQDKTYVVIDDDRLSVDTVVDYLKSFGAKTIFTFDNGRDGLDYAIANPVDFIICDWEMPEMSGLDVLREVRKHEKLKKTVFIMITSPISMEQMKVIGAGLNKVDSYLIKPFRGRALLEKILEAETDRIHTSKKTVIVCDDDHAVRQLVVDILADMGFDPVLQTDRAEPAYQLLQENVDDVALVISDWEMPEMTGIEFLQRVRANKTLKHTPFVMITSQTSLEMLKIQQAVVASVDYYLVKPFKVDTLKAKVEALLEETRDNAHFRMQLDIAEEALAEQDLQEAKRHFEQARNRNPKSIESYMGLARVELSRRPTRDYKAASDYLLEAIKLDPKHVPAYIELALAYEMALAPEKGTHLLREAITSCPPNAELEYQLGRLLAKRGKIEDGVLHLQKALEMEPGHPNAKALLDNAMMIKPIYKKK